MRQSQTWTLIHNRRRLIDSDRSSSEMRDQVPAAGRSQPDAGAASAIFNAATRSVKSSLLKLT